MNVCKTRELRVLVVGAKSELALALADFKGVAIHAMSTARPVDWTEKSSGRIAWYPYSSGVKLSLRAASEVRRVIRAVRPDIVHAFYSRALAHTLLATVGLRGGPRIISYRGITRPLSGWDLGDRVSYAHSRVSAHACESVAVRDSLVAAGIAPENCYVVYNSMLMPPNGRPGRAALAQFNIPPQSFVVGTMATMRRVKGIDLLLRAATRCHDLRDTYWLLMGRVEDPLVPALAADDRIRDRVRLVGHRADASRLISGADLMVMPSRAEALSQAVIEAMYQGVCPVVSDAGGMKEIVRHGLDGWVVPKEDETALACTIRMLHDRRQLVAQLATSARQRVYEEFTFERMAVRTLAMYHSVLGHTQATRAARAA
jgi:glycosyltransferase involved in cell wall biosynthesis